MRKRGGACVRRGVCEGRRVWGKRERRSGGARVCCVYANPLSSPTKQGEAASAQCVQRRRIRLGQCNGHYG
jgi:hypothetical protein